MLEQRLSQLAIEERKGVPISVNVAVKHVKAAFGELLSTSPSTLMLSQDNAEAEAKMWDCFAEVFEQEVATQQVDCEEDLSTEQKRQILGDILVWAEITQNHYDSQTAKFVTEPHGEDTSFQRIGQLFKRAKSKRGL